jgi:hypothetical protein
MVALLRKLFKLADADLAAREDRPNFQLPTQRFDVTQAVSFQRSALSRSRFPNVVDMLG